MRLSGTGTFRPLSPVVFVQVVEGAEACARLQQQVRDSSGPVARELAFPYHPHVTVAHGISEEAMDHAFEALAEYERALETFHQRDFQLAGEQFAKCASEYDDPVAAVYVARCRKLVANPPPEEWDGVFEG